MVYIATQEAEVGGLLEPPYYKATLGYIARLSEKRKEKKAVTPVIA